MENLNINQVKEFMNMDGFLVDTRDAEIFKNGFLPESINIPLNKIDNLFNILIPKKKSVVIIAENDEQAIEAQKKITLLKSNKIIGYLSGGFDAWKKADNDYDMIIDVDADEYIMDEQFDEKMVLIDVRDESAYEESHIEDAINMPITTFDNVVNIASVDEDMNIYIHCGGGSRAIIAASMFKKQGYNSIRIINGGFKAIAAEERAKVVIRPTEVNNEPIDENKN